MTRAYWTLDFTTSLRNVRGETLHIGSPTTEGRPLAGYRGLFWRGPSSTGATSSRRRGMPVRRLWAGLRRVWRTPARHDGSYNASTLAFLDKPANLRCPSKWFIRQTPYACASFAFMFDEVYKCVARETLTLCYRMVVTKGGLDAAGVVTAAAAWQAGG